MKTLTKKHYTILIFIMVVSMLFTLSGCDYFEKDVSKDEAVKIYEDLAKSFNLDAEKNDLIKATASFPINKIEVTTKTTVKTKDVGKAEETTTVHTLSILGDENNLTLEAKENDGEKQSTNYLYIKDGKYYSAEEGKTDSPTEIPKDNFEFGLVFSYYLFICDLEGSNNLIGTSDIKNGFESAKKELKSLTINAKVLDKKVKVTLSNKLFKSEYKLQEFTMETIEIEDNVTTTEITTIKYSYR